MHPDTMRKSVFCPLFFPYFLLVFFPVSFIVFSSTRTTIPVVSAEDKEPSSSESKPKFSTGFPDISAAKHASNENERLAKLTNGRKKLNVVLVTCEFDGPTNNGGIGTQFTALAKLYAKIAICDRRVHRRREVKNVDAMPSSRVRALFSLL